MVSQIGSNILVHLGQLSNFRAGYTVSRGALQAALASDSPSEAALNEAAQSLLEDGFVTANPWTLTPKGLDRSRTILWMFPASEESCVSEPAPAQEEVPPSPWADDPSGVVILESVAQDSYSSDSYIRVLGISQSNCYGGYRDNSTVCKTCPILGSCQAQQFIAFSEASATLNRMAVSESSAPQTTTTTTVSSAERAKELRKIVDEITSDTEPVRSAQPLERGILKTVTVRSVCNVCFRPLEEGTQALFVTGKGYRHSNPCKR